MKQLGKNIVLSLCIVATVLVVVGLKRKFGGATKETLLSQRPEDVERDEPVKSSPQPRVVQAKPLGQRDRASVSPTRPRYPESPNAVSPAKRSSISPIATTSPATQIANAPQPLATTDSPITATVGDEPPQAAVAMKPPTTPVSIRPLPEFVLTGPEDSFWSISEQVYGSGSYYRALFRHNEASVLRPDQLRAGIEVRTPPLSLLRDRYPTDFPTDALSLDGK
jgi:hypothetical protein